MRLSLSLPGFGGPNVELVRQIRSFGFDSVRVDVHPDDHEHNWEQVKFFSTAGIFPIFLLAPGHMRRSDGNAWTVRGLIDHSRDFRDKLKDCGYFNHSESRCAIEIGNEPDIAAREWKDEPGDLARTFTDCYEIIREATDITPVLSPSISNLNERGFRYLRAMLGAGLPEGCGLAFHRYPNGKDFWTPHQGFATRLLEERELRRLAGSRALWNTETGWARENPRYRLAEDEQAEKLENEIEYWHDAGAECLTIYQINDGRIEPGDNDDQRREKSYGLRTADGAWKPWVDRLRTVKEGLS